MHGKGQNPGRGGKGSDGHHGKNSGRGGGRGNGKGGSGRYDGPGHGAGDSRGSKRLHWEESASYATGRFNPQGRPLWGDTNWFTEQLQQLTTDVTSLQQGKGKHETAMRVIIKAEQVRRHNELEKMQVMLRKRATKNAKDKEKIVATLNELADLVGELRGDTTGVKSKILVDLMSSSREEKTQAQQAELEEIASSARETERLAEEEKLSEEDAALEKEWEAEIEAQRKAKTHDDEERAAHQKREAARQGRLEELEARKQEAQARRAEAALRTEPMELSRHQDVADQKTERQAEEQALGTQTGGETRREHAREDKPREDEREEQDEREARAKYGGL